MKKTFYAILMLVGLLLLTIEDAQLIIKLGAYAVSFLLMAFSGKRLTEILDSEED